MSYQFTYHGGIWKPDDHVSEKFLLFLIAGGQELHFNAAKRDSLVSHAVMDPDYDKAFDHILGPASDHARTYETSLPFGKIFVGRQGFGVPRQYFSFYFRFKEEPHPVVTIKTFPGMTSRFNFIGRISFLSKVEALEILPKDTPSYNYLQKQSMLPLDTLRAMVKVDRSEMRKGVRHLRIKKRKGVK